MINISNNKQNQSKFLIFIAMLYVVVLVTSNLMTYKIINVFGIQMAAASLVFPFTYFAGDIIAEVYGYKVARALIWYSLIIIFLFATVTHFLINLPSPATFHNQEAYNFVLGPLPRIFMGDILGILIGSFSNVYVISKWKVLVHGKYFWIRSLCSTAVGAFVATLIAFIIMYSHVLPLSKIVELIFASYTVKLIFAVISVFPASIIVVILKRFEGIDVYDYDTNFNPFKFSLNDSRI